MAQIDFSHAIHAEPDSHWLEHLSQRVELVHLIAANSLYGRAAVRCLHDQVFAGESPRLAELLEQARREYDYVVVDTPPLVALPDCRVLANHVDAFLLVVTAHKTPRRLLEAALGAVDPARILGLVFNGDDDSPTAQYGRWFRGGHGRNGAPS